MIEIRLHGRGGQGAVLASEIFVNALIKEREYVAYHLSPPSGLALFVMKATSPPEITVKDIYKAALSYCVLDFIGVGLVFTFPVLATWFKGG
jgi:TRAP-type mannitol/chloroaromatic compound transport system permease large subunit